MIPATPLARNDPPAVDLPPDETPYEPAGPWERDLPSNLGGPNPTASDRPESADTAYAAKIFRDERLGLAPEENVIAGPAAPGPEAVALDLFGAIEYGVQHSRQYRNQMDALYIAALDTTLQRHLFEPRPFTTISATYAGGQRDVAYKSAVTATVDAGVRQKLPYGGEIVAETLVNFVNAVSGQATDGESAQVVLSGSIPLLRGAGLVNLEPLIESERQVVYQVRAFENFRRQFAVDVARQYFAVLTQLQAVNNRRVTVSNAASLLERATAIYKAAINKSSGVGSGSGGSAVRVIQVTFLEVQRSLQQLLQAQESLLQAQQQYLTIVDSLKLLLGTDIRQPLDVVPVELKLDVPDTQSQDPIHLAEQFRLDLQTARDQVDDARRQVAVADNGLLPDLNLTGQGQLGSPAGAPASELNGHRTGTYTAGVSLSLPLDRLAERNVYREALINYQRAQRDLAQLHDQIAADVRAAVRSIRTAQESLLIERRDIELAIKRGENADILFLRGDITARDVVDSQNALLSAQDTYESARATLRVQVLTYLQQTGTLRLDPTAGALGRAMDRRMVQARNATLPAAPPGLSPPARGPGDVR